MNNLVFNSLEDFIEDLSFHKWVLGELPDADGFWYKWQIENPDKLEIFHQAKSIVFSLQMKNESISEVEIEQELKKFKESAIKLKEETQNRRFSLDKTIWWAAASVILVAFIGGWLWRNNMFFNVKSPFSESVLSLKGSLIEKTNTSETPLKVLLSDGSIVTLQKNSRVRYPESFAKDKREIYLTGEAFFEVTKNPNKPFYVYAQEVVTKVLGTSFNIKAYEGEKDVWVSVKTGKVSVFSQSDLKLKEQKPDYHTKGVVLMPNQQVIYSRDQETLSKGIIADPIKVVTTLLGKNLVFDNTPVNEVFTRLEGFYGIKIIYDEQLLSNCSLKADLSDDNTTLYDKMKIICKSMGGSYEVVDGQIVVTSKGCNP